MPKSIKTLAIHAPVGYIELVRRNRNFRNLWLGQVVSQMGDWFDTIALYTIILNLTGSGRNVGLLMVARFVPSFVFGPLSGVIADRFSRRSIMIISDLLRAVVVLGFLLVRRADQLWIIYVLTVLQLVLLRRLLGEGRGLLCGLPLVLWKRHPLANDLPARLVFFHVRGLLDQQRASASYLRPRLVCAVLPIARQ